MAFGFGFGLTRGVDMLLLKCVADMDNLFDVRR